MFASGDGAGELDGAAIKKQLFRHRCLAGVGVRNDGKGPAPSYFLRNIHKGAKCSAQSRQRNG